ncbi:hypothetical protein L1987_48680 [Smallanthus sonchifolius]|uniref:Uncharacterized protein n=1 Tax=Smallanthus sonchifolius TaxID=185202 RepID=A0ACB9FTI8_9ASTR|nr:hypothetical protein L1987_48680 [Smallanthus sonchifolius]
MVVSAGSLLYQNTSDFGLLKVHSHFLSLQHRLLSICKNLSDHGFRGRLCQGEGLAKRCCCHHSRSSQSSQRYESSEGYEVPVGSEN